MFTFFKKLFNKQENQFGSRSTEWKKVRNEFIKKHPSCAACGSKIDLEVHHVVPYHIDPSLELDTNNLITLCGKRCHYLFGHFCDWKSWNKDVIIDTASYNSKRVMRPHKKEDDHASNHNNNSSSVFKYNFFSWNN